MGSFVNFLYSSIHRYLLSGLLYDLKTGRLRESRISLTRTRTRSSDETAPELTFFLFLENKIKSLPCTRTPTETHQRVLSRACTHADKQRSPPKKLTHGRGESPEEQPQQDGRQEVALEPRRPPHIPPPPQTRLRSSRIRHFADR